MQPNLKEGDRVVVFRWAYILSQPKKGDVVIFEYNDGNEYVKRIIATGKGKFVVKGDNKGDSKSLPSVPKESLIGKVIMKY